LGRKALLYAPDFMLACRYNILWCLYNSLGLKIIPIDNFDICNKIEAFQAIGSELKYLIFISVNLSVTLFLYSPTKIREFSTGGNMAKKLMVLLLIVTLAVAIIGAVNAEQTSFMSHGKSGDHGKPGGHVSPDDQANPGDNSKPDDQVSPESKPSKLTCSVWTDNDIYVVGDRVTLSYSVNKPCNVQIVVNRPDGSSSTIVSKKVNAGTYSIPGLAREPYGDRDVSLKAWTTKPKNTCYSSCSYTIAFFAAQHSDQGNQESND
jgi:hypothetical protein